MAVLDPLRVVIDNFEPGRVEQVAVENNPNDETAGTHEVPFGRELYIERGGLCRRPAEEIFRLKPDGEVRLKGAYIVRYASHECDEAGRVTCVHVTYDRTRAAASASARSRARCIGWRPRPPCRRSSASMSRCSRTRARTTGATLSSG